ncbi:uncharacterized protein [Aegilops tauschii subsp. strangulata]|uniref:uncharacterized protein n=1 Tax=Aegilops tauschii subsp. strangulata TaxID=200361 RepID=UPI003CC8B044
MVTPPEEDPAPVRNPGTAAPSEEESALVHVPDPVTITAPGPCPPPTRTVHAPPIGSCNPAVEEAPRPEAMQAMCGPLAPTPSANGANSFMASICTNLDPDFHSTIAGPWVLGGDFNMISLVADKNNDRINHRMMKRFHRLISDLALRDIYLHGRRYTWSNEKMNPTLVKNDQCSPPTPVKQRFHFERFWTKLDGFQQLVVEAWNSVAADPDPFRTLYFRLKATRHPLQGWSTRTLGYGAGHRPLSPSEAWLRRELKRTYLGLASLKRSIPRERVCFCWLKEGGTNVAFFKIHAAHRSRKYHIAILRVGDSIVSEDDAMARAAFAHFSNIIGRAETREFSLCLNEIDPRHFDLAELDCPFTEDVIWRAVKMLPLGKAPGPDGFTAEFLRACWSTIKGDICAAFDKIYSMNGCGFQKLNQALITLLPKKADASTLSDCHPISLIHLIAKLFAKVLSLCLAPRMPAIVSTNQSTFIAGCGVHDNFMFV